ncbi:hypothetical protein [Methylibium sp.]|nr:hypothetical protein [Methylibium sp.]
MKQKLNARSAALNDAIKPWPLMTTRPAPTLSECGIHAAMKGLK